MKLRGNIVFVGADLCARAAVLATVGYTMRHCECEAEDLRVALLQSTADAVLFQCVPHPPSRLIVATARGLTTSPLILFGDTSSAYDPRDFDFVLTGLCSPNDWLPQIAEAIASRRSAADPKPPLSQQTGVSRNPRPTRKTQ